MDLIGKVFGRLTVVENAQRKGYVLCKCECGRYKEIRANSLTKTYQPTRSCGCIHTESVRRIGAATISKNSRSRIETDTRYNTNFGVIEQKNPPKNNRSGKKGIWFNEKRGKWEAYISVHNRRIHLGRYDNREDAEMARNKAEEEYFIPIIEEKNNQ